MPLQLPTATARPKPSPVAQLYAAGVPSGTSPANLQKQLAASLISQVGQGSPDYSQVFQLARARRDAVAAQMAQALRAQQQTRAPKAKRIGNLPGAALELDHAGPVSPNAPGVIALAKKYLGTKYVWGGTTPKGFDCSGFVQWVYAHKGVKLPRTTYEQIKVGKPIGRNQLQAGDIIFFSKGGDVHHEALYIGHGQFIHAPHTGDVVKISSLSEPYYAQQFAGGRRVR